MILLYQLNEMVRNLARLSWLNEWVIGGMGERVSGTLADWLAGVFEVGLNEFSVWLQVDC